MEEAEPEFSEYDFGYQVGMKFGDKIVDMLELFSMSLPEEALKGFKEAIKDTLDFE